MTFMSICLLIDNLRHHIWTFMSICMLCWLMTLGITLCYNGMLCWQPTLWITLSYTDLYEYWYVMLTADLVNHPVLYWSVWVLVCYVDSWTCESPCLILTCMNIGMLCWQPTLWISLSYSDLYEYWYVMLTANLVNHPVLYWPVWLLVCYVDSWTWASHPFLYWPVWVLVCYVDWWHWASHCVIMVCYVNSWPCESPCLILTCTSIGMLCWQLTLDITPCVTLAAICLSSPKQPCPAINTWSPTKWYTNIKIIS